MLVDLSDSVDRGEELALQLPDHVLEEFRGADRQAELRLMLSKRNTVRVTPPIVRPYREAIDTETRDRLRLPPDRCQFVAVLTTVDCRPDPDCRFNWLRVEFTLGADEPRPIACRLYPERAEDPVKQIRAMEFGAEMSISAMGLTGPSVKGGHSVKTVADTLQYRVMTFGRWGSIPAWQFKSTTIAPEVIGDMSLALIVAVPSDLESTAVIKVSAEAQLKNVPFAVPLLTRRSADGLHRDTFLLRAQEA
jgi:hypothetical protein